MGFVDKKLSEITPYKNNPRNNDEAVGPVAESIKEFGFKVPIVVDKNGEIINSHTRYKAAQKLGLETVPVIVADDLSEEQIKAFRLADNKVCEIAVWDLDLLNEELNDILDLDMSAFGFELEIDDENQENLDADFEEIEDDSVLIVEAESEEELEKLYDEYYSGKNKAVAIEIDRLFAYKTPKNYHEIDIKGKPPQTYKTI
ncbi:TPA: ParB N-terminal domain-containing protein [Streptococcus pyogenes]